MLFSLFCNVAPQHGFKFPHNSGNCLLPSYSKIQRVTLSCSLSPFKEQNDEGVLMYIKSKYKSLVPSDKTVTLLVDEIHLKPYFDCKGGNVVGTAYNTNEAATSAFAFTVNSVFSKFKEVVNVLSIWRMDAKSFSNILLKTIVGLEESEFNVISVITDNNTINRKAMSFFAEPANLSVVCKHPVDKSRPLFFILYTVYILKYIRNNWINQKACGTSMIFPPFTFNEILCTNSLSLAGFSSLRL